MEADEELETGAGDDDVGETEAVRENADVVGVGVYPSASFEVEGAGREEGMGQHRLGGDEQDESPRTSPM